MASVVDICNMALSNKLGANRITSLVDDSKEARECSLAYPNTRDLILNMHPWNFTLRRATLSPTVSTPDHGYDYSYQIPADCHRVLEVDTDYDWVSENTLILTDEGTALKIRYQAQETDPEKFPPLVVELIATRLAYTICEAITQSPSKKAEIKNDLKELWPEARKLDAQEGSVSQFKEDSWVEARW